ncbi:MAG: GNAT family N-acetyltransferase [endosymbiont of Galathealinum brachiosum]|uniref:GNAT family N-acetyltransferase n=1 Tax=endosymbiont of Galathealinum brachiosum TaxID=2200906 RepID=A0A370D9H1_9GAMM|nr:MAG: GNAT family N-acetyltransferase [endosymbiont of Galathealinum brachiosum]
MFEKILITDKLELKKHKKEIIKLFHKSFNAELDEKLWEWAYIENPCGDPVVSLYYHEGALVGHYAVIPVRLKYNGTGILAALSMTTMVDVSYRRHGLFIEQANVVYEEAKKLNYSLVYGFPNMNSAPGFKKRLGWTIDTQGCVVELTSDKLPRESSKKSKNQIEFSLDDELMLNWRLSKPGMKYIKDGNVIYKEFENEHDLIFHDNYFDSLDKNRKYNLYVSDCNDYDNEKSFDYAFGYKIFDEHMSGCNFKVDLIMSDVF